MRFLAGDAILVAQNEDMLVMEVSAEVRVTYFRDVVLTADYILEMSDPRGRASLSLSEKE